ARCGGRSRRRGGPGAGRGRSSPSRTRKPLPPASAAPRGGPAGASWPGGPRGGSRDERAARRVLGGRGAAGGGWGWAWAASGGGQQGPGVPALALGTGPRGADLPAAGAGQQAGSRIRAGERDPGRQGEAEAGGDPQHVALAAALEELPQPGAAAVDLIHADVI